MDFISQSISIPKQLLMDINKILSADVLDIIFEGRNKEYGAYDLRKTYNKRLKIALTATTLFCGMLFGGYLLANNFTGEGNKMAVNDIQLIDVKPPAEVEPPVAPPPKQLEVKQVQTIKNTTLVIVKEVKADERPPEITELEDARIGTFNQKGVIDDNIVAPPVQNTGNGVIDQPKKQEEDWDSIFSKVEIESSYAGGPAAWARYLNKNLRYPQAAMDNEIEGTVYVQFIVDKEGNVSDVEAVSGHEELRQEAVRVIKKSGKWEPAIQNGRKVKSYKRQPIIFKFMSE
jgi:periplasmic protein TonB